MCYDFCYAETVIQLADTVSVYFIVLRRHHNLQRSNPVNKILSKIANGKSKSDVAVNLPEVCKRWSSVQKSRSDHNIIIRG